MSTPVIVTRVAHAGYTDVRYFGYSTFDELLGSETYMGLNAMAVTGRRIDRESLDMLDELSVIVTVADPRIWPLKLTRVVASYGGTLVAFAAGQLCLESDLLGQWTTLYAAELWDELRRAIGDDHMADVARVDAEITALLARKKRLAGYGVPFRERDERMDALRKRVEQRGWQDRPFWRLQDVFSRRVQAERAIGPNITAGVAAVLLDMGFTVPQVPAMTTFFLQHMYAATAIEGARQAPAVLRSLPIDTVNYIGEPARKSPRAK